MTTRRTKVCNTPECRRVRALLSDFIDRTLHWRTSRHLQGHLESCAPCRCYVASIERTILLYRERPVVDVPVAVRGHLRELLRERHERSPKGGAGRCRAEDAAVGAKRETSRPEPAKRRSTKP